MVTNVCGNIYTFPITLPDNPLKWLNCYVVKSASGRDLLIDTGFNRPECMQALLEGMRSLDMTAQNTDVFLTHLHADHTGNAFTLQGMGSRVLMGTLDHDRMIRSREENWQPARDRTAQEGMTPEEVPVVFQHNPGILYGPEPFDVFPVEQGMELAYGGHTFEAVHTPGHTPGHICLYDRNEKIMFLGDHVLFDITPNICAWYGVSDSLGDYLNSLEKIRAFDISVALPAHRNTSDLTVAERIDDLLIHHERRLCLTEEIINAHPGLTAYEIAAKLKWRIRCDSWEDFPPGQKYFALGETIAHVDHLLQREKLIRRTDDKGVHHYYSV